MEPKTKKEHYLAAIAGDDVSIPEPKTPQEYYLKKIAENGGGGGGIFVVTFTEVQDNNYSSDKTFAETYEAAMDGKQIFAKFDPILGVEVLAPLSGIAYQKTTDSSTPIGITFWLAGHFPQFSADTISTISVTFGADNTALVVTHWQ